jgi:DNA-binding CsgD family transcriptional regulator
MNTTPNELDLIESFYRPADDLAAWWERTLLGVLEHVQPGGYAVHLRVALNPDLTLRSSEVSVWPDDPPPAYQRFFAAMLDPDVPGSFGADASAREETLLTYPSVFMSEDTDFFAVNAPEVERFWREYAGPLGVTESMVLQLGDLSHREAVGIGLSGPLGWGAERRRSWEYLSAHMHAGLRLQRAQHADPVAAASAVLAADGRVLDVSEESLKQDAGLRETVREVARRVDRARGNLRRRPLDALEVWQGLVEGEYSLVDHFDSDGRRLVLLKPNAPGAVRSARLSKRERQVVTEAGKGFPNKLIAYNLGLSPSSVSTLLARSMSKLGLSSRAQLVELATRLACTPGSV